MDGDTLLQSPVDKIFNKLSEHDCVVYDFQYKDLTHVYDVTSSKLKQVFSPQDYLKKYSVQGFMQLKKNSLNQKKKNG